MSELHVLPNTKQPCLDLQGMIWNFQLFVYKLGAKYTSWNHSLGRRVYKSGKFHRFLVIWKKWKGRSFLNVIKVVWHYRYLHSSNQFKMDFSFLSNQAKWSRITKYKLWAQFYVKKLQSKWNSFFRKQLTFLRIITGFSDTVSRLDVILLCARRRMGDGALGSGAGSSRSGGLVPTSVMSISDLARNRSLAVRSFLGTWRVEWELRKEPDGITIPSLQRWFDIPTNVRRWTALNKQLQFVDKPAASCNTSSCYRKPNRCASVTLATNRVVRRLVSWQKPSFGYGPWTCRSSGAVCRERLVL